MSGLLGSGSLGIYPWVVGSFWVGYTQEPSFLPTTFQRQNRVALWRGLSFMILLPRSLPRKLPRNPWVHDLGTLVGGTPVSFHRDARASASALHHPLPHPCHQPSRQLSAMSNVGIRSPLSLVYMFILLLKSSLDLIRTIHNSSDRRTKVVCTLGPACWSVDGLISLIDAGRMLELSSISLK